MKNRESTKMISFLLVIALLWSVMQPEIINAENFDASLKSLAKLKVTIVINWDETYELLDLTNAERKEQGLCELKLDKRLVDVCIYRIAENVLTPGHVSANTCGFASPADRLRMLNYSNPFDWYNENILFNLGGEAYDEGHNYTPGGQHSYESFKASNGHHKNYMNPERNACGMMVGGDNYGSGTTVEVIAHINDESKIIEQPKKSGIEFRTIEVEFMDNCFDYNVCMNVPAPTGYYQSAVRGIGAKAQIYVGEKTRMGDYLQPADWWYNRAFDYICQEEGYYRKLHKNDDYGCDFALSMLKPIDWENLNFTSSDPTILTVDEHGYITGKKIGTATIHTSFKGREDLKHDYEISVVAIPPATPTPTTVWTQRDPEAVLPEDIPEWVPNPTHTPFGTLMYNKDTNTYYLSGLEERQYTYNETTGYYYLVGTDKKYEWDGDWMNYVPEPTPDPTPDLEPNPTQTPTKTLRYNKDTDTYYLPGFEKKQYTYNETTGYYYLVGTNEKYEWDGNCMNYVSSDSTPDTTPVPEPLQPTPTPLNFTPVNELKTPAPTKVPYITPTVPTTPTTPTISVTPQNPQNTILSKNSKFNVPIADEDQVIRAKDGNLKKNDIVQKYENGKWETVKKLTKTMKSYTYGNTGVKIRVVRGKKKVL